jgi:hypothetical protein
MLRTTFIDDKTYLNIELGAGCGTFGSTYFSKCYLTDLDEGLRNSCSSCSIDWFCDAHKLPWSSDRFQKIILCNPYGFGFDSEESAAELLTELGRVSKNGSEIIIIGHKANKYCAPERVSKRISNFTNPNFSFDIEIEELDTIVHYKSYIFRTMDGQQTWPNKKIKINVTK